MRQEMKRSNTNLGFDIDGINGEWDLESTNMIRMVYIKVWQSPQIVNGLDYGKTCTKPYKKKSSTSNRDGYARLASIGHVLMTQS